MTQVTSFNKNPPGTRIESGAFDKSIGKEVPLKNAFGEELGKARILDVFLTDDGLYVTYETDVNLGLTIEL